jgi:hypothetical protein
LGDRRGYVFFVVEEDGEVVFWFEGGDGGVGEIESEGGKGMRSCV